MRVFLLLLTLAVVLIGACGGSEDGIPCPPTNPTVRCATTTFCFYQRIGDQTYFAQCRPFDGECAQTRTCECEKAKNPMPTDAGYSCSGGYACYGDAGVAIYCDP